MLGSRLLLPSLLCILSACGGAHDDPTGASESALVSQLDGPPIESGLYTCDARSFVIPPPGGDWDCTNAKPFYLRFGAANASDAPATITMYSADAGTCSSMTNFNGEAAHFMGCGKENHSDSKVCYYRFDKSDAYPIANGNWTAQHGFQWIALHDTSHYVTLHYARNDDGNFTDSFPLLDNEFSRDWPMNPRFAVDKAKQPNVCGITCKPPTPPIAPTVPPAPVVTCGFAGDPGWCHPGWQPPHGFVSPLVLDLDATRSSITFLGRSVPFDIDGAGNLPLDWVKPDRPFLALDLNRNGIIDDGTELFGTATRLGSSTERAANGFLALAQYDANGDHVIDRKDPIFNRLRLWFDRNSDGVSQANELRTLTGFGITAIHLDAKPVVGAANENAFVAFESTFDQSQCGSSMYVADVWFKTVPR